MLETPPESPVIANLFLIDEHPIVLAGIAAFFQQSPEFRIVGQASHPEEAMSAIERARPDLIITELAFGGLDGLSWVRNLAERFISPRLLAYTGLDTRVYALRVLKQGAHGFLSKRDDPALLVQALRTLRRNEIYLKNTEIQTLLREAVVVPAVDPKAIGKGRYHTLGNRELHVFKLLGCGHNTRQIAESMKISRKTVEAHRGNIMRKLGIDNSTKLVQQAAVWVRENS